MYLKCAHPECSADFDYGQGRLFRFHQTPQQVQQPSHWHSVIHFWLCTRCCEVYTIEYQKGLGVLLMQRLEKLAGGQPSHYILREEKFTTTRRTRRHARSAARKRERKKELASGPTSTIEVLENRILERRA
jgi:hypothetical protein